MRKLIVLSAAVVTMAFAACSNSATNSNSEGNAASQTFTLDTTGLKTGETFYQCEMHPEVISDKPGECPKSGMDLEMHEKL